MLIRRLILISQILVWGGPGVSLAQPTPRFEAAGLEVSVVGALGELELSVEVETLETNLEVATLRLSFSEAAAPPPFTLAWSIPSHDVLGQWTSGSYFSKSLRADWYPSKVSSKLARDAPVMLLFGADDTNRLTFAVSDALNQVSLSAGVREEDGRIHCRIDFFEEKHRQLSELEIRVRFDRRALAYETSLTEVTRWWETFDGLAPSSVPAIAREPMYSSWYSYHQSVSAAELLEEVTLGKALGLEAIIVDDGWQTLDSARGYAFTGDWKPERIPEMKDFVDGVHQAGMKFLLWYATPLVGEKSETFERFEGKFLRYWDGQGAYELDPRYPEVRAHLIGTYRDALEQWGVDGFKLDFLGRFVANENTVLEATEGRDFASVNEATDRLMTDIIVELRKLKPDVMIEFRQPYIGPLMRKYGNMFRAGDSPNALVANRVRVADLRLLSGATAVHSDMLMWHYDEPVEVAARQLLNVLFSVPQVSVRLDGVPEDHVRMLKFYLDYWKRNRATLLDGSFRAASPMANYPMLASYDSESQIAVLYEDVVVKLPSSESAERIELINATRFPRLVLEIHQSRGRFGFAIRDALGKLVDQGQVELDLGLHRLAVPVSGVISLFRSE